MAVKPPYDNMDELLTDFDAHPVEWLLTHLGDPDKRRAFAHSTVKTLLSVDPEFPKVCTRDINLDRALQVGVGDPGIAHVLMLGIDKLRMSALDVFWRDKDPPKI